MRLSSLFRRMGRTALLALVAAVLMAAFFLAVIMGQPQKTPEKAVQPLPSPLPGSVYIGHIDELGALLDIFPAPVMAAMNSSALTLVQGSADDVPYEEGVARVVSLAYRTADGQGVLVQSICPARALSVMGKGDFTLTGKAGHPLAGIRSIWMESAQAVRMHAQGDEALYVITLPNQEASALRQITSLMQTYRGSAPQ